MRSPFRRPESYRRPPPGASPRRRSPRIEDLEHFALAVAGDLHEPFGDGEGLFLRAHLDEGEAVDELLRLGERTVGDGELPGRKTDTSALGRPLQTARHEQDSRLPHLLGELP